MEASEVAEADEVNEAAEVSKGSRVIDIFNTGLSFDVIDKKTVGVFGGASTTKVTYYMEVKKVQILTFEINSVWCGGKDNYDLCNNKDSKLE